jgi:hypothetical protein
METRFYLRRSDSQRSDNDFHIVHVCDSRPPQFGPPALALGTPPPRPALASQVWGCLPGPCRSCLPKFFEECVVPQYFIPRTEASLACGCLIVKTHWETGIFPLGGGLPRSHPAIPPADLPISSRQHDVPWDALTRAAALAGYSSRERSYSIGGL